MNLYELDHGKGVDLTRLARATDRPRILFLTNQVLGWRTFGDELARITGERDDIYAVHVRFRVRVGRLGRATHRLRPGGPHGAHGELVRTSAEQVTALLDALDPTRNLDAIHVSPHLLALGVVRHGWRGPLSVIFDADVRQAKMQRQNMTLARVEREFAPLLDDEARVVRRADQLWAMSRWAATNMASAYGIDPESIGVVPPVRSVEARSWDDDPTDRVPIRIAFVGNDLRRKGGDRLIAWHQQRWVGRAELHVFTAARRPRRPLPGVVWHQNVHNRALVSEYLKTMDLFVLPTMSDMSPFAVTEAAAAGLPVVSSAIGGIGELVQDGVTGFLCDPEDEPAFVDAVERLFDPEVRRRIGRASLAAACTRLNADIVMRKFVDGIRDLVA